MNIVFFGTAGFGPTHNSSGVILDTLVRAGYKPVVLVTAPDTPSGRKQQFTPPPAKVSAQNHNIPVLQPDTLTNFGTHIARYKPDLIALVAYGKIVPKEILEIPTHGALCVHPSLLPKFRGPSPVQHTILEGEKKTGISIILMDEGVDHGPILAQKEFPIKNAPTTLELSEKLAVLGGDLLVETIQKLVGKKIQPQEQDHSQATYTKRFSKEDGRIDWSKPALYIERQVRALYPWPGTFALFEGKNLKILKVSALPANLARLSSQKLSEAKFLPGTAFLTAEKKLAIQCGEDALIVEELQLEGGKPMSSKEFLLGYKNVLGTILC